jgi:ADP-ribose pyrophosphatase YjhB (NUDIX family)
MNVSQELKSPMREFFRFCPRCAESKPHIRAGREMSCSHCGFRFFFNVAAAAGAFIFIGSSLLLCIRAKDPGRGLLDVPGGFVEFDESIEQGLEREVLEELGVEVQDLKYLTSAANRYRFQGVEYRTSDAFFTAKVITVADIKPQDDVSDFRLYDPFSVDPAEFAFESTRQGFKVLLERLRGSA